VSLTNKCSLWTPAIIELKFFFICLLCTLCMYHSVDNLVNQSFKVLKFQKASQFLKIQVYCEKVQTALAY
jgi:hypothetical protein